MNIKKNLSVLLKAPINFIRNLNIIPKLALSYIVTVVLCITLLTAYYSYSTMTYLQDQATELVENNLKQYRDNIEYKTMHFGWTADFLYMNKQLQELLFRENYDNVTKLQKTLEILTYIENIRESFSEVKQCTLYVQNNTINETDNLIYHLENHLEEPWLDVVSNMPDQNFWMVTTSDEAEASETGTKQLSLIRKMRHLRTPIFESNFLGYLKIDFSIENLFGDLDNINQGVDGWVQITDSNYIPIYSSAPNTIDDKLLAEKIRGEIEQIDQNEEYFIINGIEKASLTSEEVFEASKTSQNMLTQKYLTVYEKIEDTGWNIIYLVSFSRFYQQIQHMKNTATIIIGCLVIMFFGLSWLMASGFTKSIRNLAEAMKKVENGTFNVVVTETGYDEVGYLAKGFNSMVKKLDSLIHQVYQIKIKEKEYDLQALQAQLNPHFLYNTLASISWMGMRSGMEDITTISNALARFYKISLSKGKNIITVEKELEQIQAYIQILKIRYRNTILFHSQIDKSVVNMKTLKLILQPFVENALIHGMYKSKNTITIVIRVQKLQDCIEWKIIDDGVGISNERLKKLFSENTEETGYGMFNVDKRIRVYFSSNYGVQLWSKRGIGTVVTIRTPLSIQDNEENGS